MYQYNQHLPFQNFQKVIMETPGFRLWDESMARVCDFYIDLWLKSYYLTPFVMGNADAWKDLQMDFINPNKWFQKTNICRF